MSIIKVGTCGWGYLPRELIERLNLTEVKGTKLAKYAKIFEVVEINSTFYKLPREKTAEKWYKEAKNIRKDFEFTLKVNKVITHQDRFKSEVSWEVFKQVEKIAKILNVKILLFQTSASFKPTKENLENIKNFFSNINNFEIAWEFRGKEWLKAKEKVKKIIEDLNIIHVTDPFNFLPFTFREIVYFRLHGSPPGEKMYYYKYSDKDLIWLMETIEKISKSNENIQQIYTMFNNVWMYEDALRFKELIRKC